MRLGQVFPVNMSARDRGLPEWLNLVGSGRLSLPRFQRPFVWGPDKIAGLLTSVFLGLPVGTALVLTVGDKEKFESRLLNGEQEGRERVVEQLLDGQQRLTALWKAFNGRYDWAAFLVGLEDDPAEEGAKRPKVEYRGRWSESDKLRPLWVDNPGECWRRGLVPVPMVRPGVDPKEVRGWIAAAAGGEPERVRELEDLTDGLRERAVNYNLPYLALDPRISARTALDVFIKMNTNSVELSVYDIVVALVENDTGKDFRENMRELLVAAPGADRYGDPMHLALNIAALREGRLPTPGEFQTLDFHKMIGEWEIVTKGVAAMVAFLEEERVFDLQRLPTTFVLPVIAALIERLPKGLDAAGNARILLRKYLWRSFLTQRYGGSAASNALADYRALGAVLAGAASESSVPVFNEDEYACPLPSKEDMKRAGWPKNSNILGRGLMALQIKKGAEDLADGSPAALETFTNEDRRREYHHLFPASTLAEAGLAPEEIDLALNCALITWATNRNISAKDPLRYLQERSGQGLLGEAETRRRLDTHLIPYDELAVGLDHDRGEAGRELTRKKYETFLEARAALLSRAVRQACDGQALSEALDRED